MTIAVTRPAPFADLCAMLADQTGPALGFDASFFARLQTIGKSWGWSVGETTIACAGLMELPDGALEAWFACRPEASKHMLAVTRIAQLTLRHAGHDRTIRCRVVTEPGARLARCLGFRPAQGDLWMLNP